MPIYEFYCSGCHMIFNFFSKTVNTTKIPPCPKCEKKKLERRVSLFSTASGEKKETDEGVADIDESKVEKAMGLLANEADGMDENDPRQAAQLMRKLTDMTGVNLNPQMEEALGRMEAGEDPDAIEAEMGDMLEGEEPFTLKQKGGRRKKRGAPGRDETLYDL
ncbi:MAG: zinc ribbon domain-containing protein [Deltaproteobacteria bacterium]|nr:zinc ribbon domain-containing protein [Deltaproteobacteria bacterium]